MKRLNAGTLPVARRNSLLTLNLLLSTLLLSGCLELGKSDSPSGTPSTAAPGTIVDQAPSLSIGTPANVDEYKRRCPTNSIYIGTKSYSTIQAAVTAAVSGDVILVGKGNYNENVSITNKTGIKLFTQCQPQIYGFSLSKSQDIEIDGFDVRHKSTNEVGVLIGKIDDDEDDDSDNYAGANTSSDRDRSVTSISAKTDSNSDNSNGNGNSDSASNSNENANPNSDSNNAGGNSASNDDKSNNGKNDKPDKNANYRIVVKNLNIEGFPVTGYGLRVSTHNYDITLTNNTIHNNLGNGVFLSPSEKTTSVSLSKNVITQNGYNGIVLKGENKFTFTENVISQNGMAGSQSNGYGLKFLGDANGGGRDDKSSLVFTGNYVIYNAGALNSKKSSKDIRFYLNLKVPESSVNFSTAGIEPGCGLYADIEAPKIQIFNVDNYLTRFPEYLFLAHVTDMGLSNVKAYLNGAQFYSSVVGDILSLVTLQEGVNIIEVAAVDYAGNRSSKKLTQIMLDTVAPVLTQVTPVKDGILYSKVLPFDVPVNISSNENLSSVKVNQTAATLLNDRSATSTYTVTAEGPQSLNVVGADVAGNVSNLPAQFSAVFDNTPPTVTLGGTFPMLLNQGTTLVPITVVDANPTMTIIKVNGVEILQTGAKVFDGNIYLPIEGENVLEVEAVDAADNHSVIVKQSIYKDTTPPQIQITAPLDNTEVDRIAFSLTGKSNEKLLKLSVNGNNLSLSTDQMSFAGTYMSPGEGAQSLTWVATDLAQNQTTIQTTVIVSSKILYPELVTIRPNSQNTQLILVGSAKASRPGIKISSYTGIFGFSDDEITSNADGSFVLKANVAEQIKLKALDTDTGETLEAVLSFSTATSLSGIVRDSDDVAIPGATVSVQGASFQTITDANGAFNFPSVISGDQTIIINGSTATQTSTGPTRKFSATKMKYNIGLGQINVLPRPVYLTPIVLDGTEVAIQQNQSATVTSPNAPGFELAVASNSAAFPPEASTPVISVREIPSDRSTIAPPIFAEPTKVISLEPSGLSFSQRAEVTFKNDNELPPKTQMVIYSMNSATGEWEIDGVAEVNADGSQVKSKPGQGISHFSLIYAVPAKPYITEVSDPNLQGVDISKGSLTESIKLPSYKSLGAEIAPGLIYKSSWANPTAFVSNRIDIPNFPLTTHFDGHQLIVREECSPMGCSIGEVQMKLETTITQTDESTIVPDKIRSQLFVGNLASGISSFIDTTTETVPANRGEVIPGAILRDSANTSIVEMTGIPNKGVISYSVPLRDETTHEALPSGLYPYLARYEFYLKNMVIRTFSSVTKVFVNGDFQPEYSSPNVPPYKTTFASALKDVLPQDVAGALIVQNKSKSEFGQGWKLNIGQTILNPQGSKLVVEDAQGELATYVPKQTVSTLYTMPGDASYQTGSLTLNNYPDVYLAHQNAGTNRADILHLNANSGFNISESFPYYGSSGTIRNHDYSECPNLTGSAYWADELYRSTPWDWYYGEFNIKDHQFMNLPVISGVLPLPGGGLIVADSREHQIGVSQLSGSNHYAGTTAPIQNFVPFSNLSLAESNPAFQNFCNAIFGQNCSGVTNYLRANCRPGWANDYVVPNPISMMFATPEMRADWHNYHILSNVYALIPVPLVPNTASLGYGSFTGDSSTGYSVGFNQPGELQPFLNTTALVIDKGNNRVRKLNLNNGVVTTFAGDGSNYDQGDNVPATGAKILHPTALFPTTTGEVFIASEKGYIRRVDASGVIHLVGGMPVEGGGVLTAEGPISNYALNNPQGLYFDDVQNFLYISDTGNNRIVKFDLNTNLGTQVAGTGSCANNPSTAPQLALSDTLCSPTKLTLDSQKNIVFFDSGTRRIRKININNSGGSGPMIFASTNKDLSQITKNSDGSFERKFRNGYKVNFNNLGRETSEVDRVGNTTTFSYDTDQKLLSVTDAVNRKLEISYNGSKVSSIKDPAGRITNFSYSGNLLSRVDTPDGTHQNLEYSSEGLLTKKVNPAGNAVQYTYNKWNRLEKVIDPNLKEVVVNDSVSASMSNDYTGGTAGQFAKSGTGANDIKDTVVDANNNPTKLAKDAHGFISKITDALNRTTVIERNLEGITTAITYPDNAKVTFNYDPVTRDLLSSTDVNTGITEAATYDNYGNNLTKTNGNGQIARSSYDPNTGLLLSQTAPGGQSISYAYGANGLLSSKTIFPQSGQSQTSSYEYDSSGNLTRVVSPDGKQTQFVYDLVGNQIQTISLTTGTSTATTSYNYDQLNRLTKVTSPNGEITEYTYLATGELSTIKDPKGKIRTFEYDKLGRLTKKTDSLGQVYLFTYDAGGNLVQETDPNGNVKKYSYDALNEMIQAQLPDDLINYLYDARGKLSQSSSSTSSISWIRDSKGRIIYERSSGLGTISDYPSTELSLTYDGANNRNGLDAGIFSLAYTYDSSSRLVTLSNSIGDTFNFQYDMANRLTSLRRPGSRTDYTFKASGVVDSIIHSTDGVTRAYSQYQYDLRNYPVQKKNAVGTAIYSYDGNGQLTSATGPKSSETFGYDNLGNRITDQGGSYTYDSTSQRLIEDWQYNYSYDNNGNMIARIPKDPTKPATTYSYNSKNQLTRIQFTASALGPVVKDVSYTYDVLGRRMEKKIADLLDSNKSYSRRYVYDGDNILFEYDGSSNLLAEYTHSPLAPDDVLSTSITSSGVNSGLASNAGSFYFLKDGLNSVTEVMNSVGKVVQKYEYGAFGDIIATTDDLGNDTSSHPALRTLFSYTGRELDEESSLFYYRARAYDPKLGRFLQADPEPGKLADPSSLSNSYTYAQNRPTFMNDPSGRASVFGWIVAVAFPAYSLIAMNTSTFFQDNFGFSRGDISSYNSASLAAIIVGASILTGGAAAGAAGMGGTASGAAIGSLAGAATGGAIGAIGYPALGLGTSQAGMRFGALIGALGGQYGSYMASAASPYSVAGDGSTLYPSTTPTPSPTPTPTPSPQPRPWWDFNSPIPGPVKGWQGGGIRGSLPAIGVTL